MSLGTGIIHLGYPVILETKKELSPVLSRDPNYLKYRLHWDCVISYDGWIPTLTWPGHEV